MALKATKKQQEEIKNKILRRLEQAEAHREQLERKWVDWYKLYRCVAEPEEGTDEEGNRRPKLRRSNIFVPQIFSDIETIAPRLVASTFASRPYIAALPREGSDEAKAKVMELLLDYQMADRIKIKQLASLWARDVLITGMGPVKITWRYETRRMRVKVPDLSDELTRQAFISFGVVLKYKEEYREAVVYDDPWIELIDPFDFYWDPRALTVDDARYIIHRSRVTMDYLKKMAEQGIYKNINKITTRKDIQMHPGQLDRLAALNMTDVEPDPNEPEIELLEHWQDDVVETIANRDVVIRAEPNPYNHCRKPFGVGKVIPSRTSMCGISIIEPVETLQHELNDIRNLTMDAATLQMFKPFKVLKDSFSYHNPETLVLAPLGLIPVEDMDDLAEVDIKPVHDQLTNEQITRDDTQRATGAYDMFKGAPAPRRATATEIAGRLEQGSFRFQDMRANFESSGPLPAAELMAALNEQFLSQERIVRIAGSDGMEYIKLLPEDISAQCDLYFMGSATEPIANRDLRRQQIIQLYQTVAADPLVKRDELLKMMFGLFDIKDPERFLNIASKGGLVAGDFAQSQAGGAPGGVVAP